MLLMVEPLVVTLSASVSHIVAKVLKEEVGRSSDFKSRTTMASGDLGSPLGK
jgi:hypothetical protein